MKFLMLFIVFFLGINATKVAEAASGLNVTSETSHFIGGAAMAGGTTFLVDRYLPEHREHRAMIGFLTSSIIIAAEQSVEYALHGEAANQLVDTVAHIAGSALGAYLTDRFILVPVIQRSPHNTQVGFALTGRFH